MKFLTKNVKIALTVLVGLALLYWGVNYLKGINLLTPSNRYFTEVESVEGLLEAAPVTVNGFQVGQVHEIQYDYSEPDFTEDGRDYWEHYHYVVEPGQVLLRCPVSSMSI